MSNALATLTQKLANRLDMGDGTGLIDTLKATAFKGQVSDAQMTALMVVANQYGLNPWTREIYAFPDKNNGIVPVVGWMAGAGSSTATSSSTGWSLSRTKKSAPASSTARTAAGQSRSQSTWPNAAGKASDRGKATLAACCATRP